MKRLLLPKSLDVLKTLAAGRTLLAFDFDGTLAPIVAKRGAAAMRRTTRARFERVCSLYPTAVISGRGLRDLSTRVRGAAVRYLVGNHGLEPGFDLEATERALTEARGVLGRLVERTPGLELEDKRYSLSVHTRGCRAPGRARASVLDAVATLQVSLRVVPGIDVLNLVLASAPHKGDALLALMAKERLHSAFYLGDDVTDEDVFRLGGEHGVLTARVGASRTSAAQYWVGDQGEVDELLAHLVRFRAKLRR